MANQITDGRTSVSSGDAVTNYDDLTGAAAGTLDNEIYIEGSGSIGYYTTTTRDGILYDAATAQNWSSNVFYLWVNCGIVGLLDIKANGGLTVRFCGNTVTDWFEVYVAGSDDWPPSVSGGWTMFVVDIEDARSTAVTNGWTNGTTPATSAIRYIGISSITSATMPRMADNTWLDAIWRLPDGTAGIKVEGRNAGTTDWTWSDIADASISGAWGTAKYGDGGSIVLNTSVEFFTDDASTHAFTDTNKIILFENQEYAPADLYGLTVLGAATGTASFKMGVKTGTGDAATGAQGCTIAADAGGVRWFFDADIANIDLCGLYGCSFQHGGDFQVDNTTVEVINTFFIDCTSMRTDDSTFLRNSIIDANTADGVAFITTDDLSNLKYCNFEWSDGHAIELTTPRVASQTSTGNTFSGYGSTGTNDAAVYNNTAGAVTINVPSGNSPTYRNGTSASTTVTATKTLTVTCKNEAGNAIQGVRVRIEDDPLGTQISQGTTNASGVYQDATYNYTADEPVKIIARLKGYKNNAAFDTITSTGLSVPLTMIRDQAVNLP